MRAHMSVRVRVRVLVCGKDFCQLLLMARFLRLMAMSYEVANGWPDEDVITFSLSLSLTLLLPFLFGRAFDCPGKSC